MSLSAFDTSREHRTLDDLRALVQAIHQSPTMQQENNWCEWKCSDPTSSEGLTGIARTILGFANRAVDVAQLACHGLAYMVVGAQPQSAPGVTVIDLADLGKKLKSYVNGPSWTPHYVDYSGVTVLVIVVEAPRLGDRIYSLLKELKKNATTYKRGTVFHRGTAETEQATPNEIDMLADRYAASAVASGIARMEALQASRQATDEASQAAKVAVVPGITRGQPGWEVRNDSDAPISSIEMRTTNGEQIVVYHGSGPEWNDFYALPPLPAHDSSQLTFRPADGKSGPGILDPAEVDRLAVTFTDASGRRWEKMGSQLRKLDTD